MRKHSLDCSILLISFLIASIKCVSDLKNDFVVVVLVLAVVLGAELLSKFPENWKILLRLKKLFLINLE